jgi:hypothetical protein
MGSINARIFKTRQTPPQTFIPPSRAHPPIGTWFVPESLRKTPSQKRSEHLRNKLNRDTHKIDVQLQEDCRGCSKYPCGKSILSCNERSMTKQCGHCGLPTMYRVIIGDEWKLCKECRDKKRGV